ncbi:hypothetical protein WS58_03355 [Burkholderia pseudomultivorans]|uniref:hypothetical protein n=1 Tax=Burkholderia pseudomultivorans TaxID=1207504 RepID=UPI00075F6CDC|nr:hypothetical protein [Burkholderia pseudomultivorans]KVC52516.1 hypothetical protein WS58_03355 [Burkholderia pseudomultivorans]
MKLKAIRTWFGGRQAVAPVSDEPPLELQTIIAGASVYERASNEEGWDGAPRLMLHTERGAFFADQTDKWLAHHWPNLTDAQRARAKGMLKAHIARWQQRAQADASAASRSRPNYARDY